MTLTEMRIRLKNCCQHSLGAKATSQLLCLDDVEQLFIQMKREIEAEFKKKK